MHASHTRSRRKRGKIDDVEDDGLSLHVSRVEDTQSEAYSRSRPHSHQQTDSYVPFASRNSLAMSWEPPSFTDSLAAPDRFHSRPSDIHHRGGRDSYDIHDDDPPWSVRPKHDWNHQTSREWATNQGSSEQQNWGASTSYTDRGRGHGWQPDDRRGKDDRGDNHHHPNNDNHHHNRRRNNRKFQQRDNGWDTRRDRQPRTQDMQEEPLKDERSWEPGPGWQARGADQGGKHNRNRNNGNKNKSKKNQNKTRMRIEKEKEKARERVQHRNDDDDDLNNWQRREFHPLPAKPVRTSPVKPKMVPSRSPSPAGTRSRSRSPDSYYSHMSSRGRSHSRSLSPRSQQHSYSPVRRRSRTPTDRGRTGREAQSWKSYSPGSSDRSWTMRRGRRHSFSSASSVSRSRSRSSSRSIDDRPKPKHRLPTATSINDISLSISQTTIQQPHGGPLPTSRDSEARLNGKARTNGKQGNRRRHFSPAAEQMPPPAKVPRTSTKHHLGDSLISYHPSSASASGIADHGSPRIRKVSKAGFRPIGEPSSTVKLFFPRDEDDNEAGPAPQHKSPASPKIHSEVPAKRTRDEGVTNRDEDMRGSILSRPLPFQHISGPREPVTKTALAPQPMQVPPLAVHDSLKASIVPRPAGSGDVSISPTQQSHTVTVEPDTEGTPRPSSPSGTTCKDLYAIVSQVGEGTFGKVYKARNVITNVHVALKRIRMEAEKDGFPVTAMREIKLLQSLRHQNVVRLYEMMVSNGSVYMVFEYMDHDLTGVLSQTQFSFSEANLKSLCSQMLAGLAYLHRKGVIHRDIKGSNILINNRGELKLADFGLARFYQKRRRSDYTNRVITLWYRPPELLFGATVYGPEVDMWSAGCIMLELFTKKPVFQGNDEIHQLDVIYRILGTPSTERWQGLTALPWYELVKPKDVIHGHFRELFSRWLSPAALDLAERLLAYDPTQRVTALEALEAPYFKEEQPPPELPVDLSTLEGEWHELETKRERAKKRRKLENGLV
ncbi:Pkinase-domain-containing protein [Suillus decipiens]|nr:Pkinase-domain-containing protein [Suillus decipiens]